MVTNFIEYCFYGVSCIPAYSITFESETKMATCRIYLDKVFTSNSGVHISQIPLLLALLDEDSDYFNYLPSLILGRYQRVVNSLIYWMRRKDVNDAKGVVLTFMKNESDKNLFLDLYKDSENILRSKNTDVVRHFQSKETNNFFNSRWLVPSWRFQ